MPVNKNDALSVDKITGGDEKVVDVGPDAPLRERLKYGSPFHTKVLNRLLARLKLAKDSVVNRYDTWDQVDEQVRLHVNLDRAAKKGDGTTLSDTVEMPFERSIVVPVSYAVLTVRMAQLMGILMARDPMWSIQGSGPEDVKNAPLIESVIQYDMEQCAALLSLFTQMQDSEKYGLGVIYDVWEIEKGYKTLPVTPELVQYAALFGQPSPVPRRVWSTIKEYNKWDSVDPYRFWCDPRVPKSLFQTGEFCGHRMARSYLHLVGLSYENGGPYFNLDSLPKEAGQFRDYIPRRDSLITNSLDLSNSGSTDPLDKGYFTLDCLQVKLIPREWELGTENKPCIWWFTIANEGAIIRAHPSSYDHGAFTYSLIESNYDRHALYNLGNIEAMDGLQRFMNWLFNSHLENIRKTLNDVLIYSPTYIEEEDILNPGPARHIRLTQAGESLLLSGGLQSIQALVQQLPVMDVTKGHVETSKLIYEMIQLMMATNDPMTGQATSERKTLGEVDRMLGGSSKRLALTYRLYEEMGFHPMILRAISNRQQFTTIEQFYRIVGDALKQGDGRKLIKPVDIQGNFNYSPRSELMPPDPARAAMVWVQILMGLGKLMQLPQLAMPGPDGKVLDIRAIVKEAVKNMGVKNIDDFFIEAPMPQIPGMNIQVMPDEKVARGVEQGSIAPMQPRLPGMQGMTP